jgi:riboflavin-specific deaminase-like protein
MSMSADGKIANDSRTIHTFGSPRDLRHLYELRSMADAVLSGARTIEDTGATLGNGGERYRRARLRRGLSEFPIRVVVSGNATISPEVPLWKLRFSPILLLLHSKAAASRARRLRALADSVHVSDGASIDIDAVLRWLWREHGVRRLLVEGGAEVNAAFFRARVVDELHLTLCPLLIGGRSAPTLAEGEGLDLSEAVGFERTGCRKVGQELFLTYSRT